eukprot:TRINITY_DN1425_c0_g1_i2.p1 TRINITY_DN1425_c0_g1~~TRINITY_DN1425_c0_g1_i2.p1  ORF type:complete len:192 (+),score=28.41 TRINITY_DN1425_c0_g1_i2:66-641(+)
MYTADATDKSFNAKYHARCYCGEVRYEVDADPVDVKICHCKTCRVLHGAPMQWAAIFHKQNVRFVSGTASLAFYNAEDNTSGRTLPCKVSCGKCRTLIADEGRNMWLAFPTLFEMPPREGVPEVLKPRCHIFYAMRVMDINDGLPKWAGHKNKSMLIEWCVYTCGLPRFRVPCERVGSVWCRVKSPGMVHP